MNNILKNGIVKVVAASIPSVGALISGLASGDLNVARR